MPVILTKKYAEIVDDTLTVLLRDYDKPNMQNYDVMYHTLRGKGHCLVADFIAAFSVASAYWHLIPYKPYTIEFTGSLDLSIGKTHFTEPFLKSGGFTAIWQKEENERDKVEELRKANINATYGVWAGVFFAFIAALISCLSYVKEKPEMKESIEQLRQQNQILKSILSDTNAVHRLDTSVFGKKPL